MIAVVNKFYDNFTPIIRNEHLRHVKEADLCVDHIEINFIRSMNDNYL